MLQNKAESKFFDVVSLRMCHKCNVHDLELYIHNSAKCKTLNPSIKCTCFSCGTTYFTCPFCKDCFSDSHASNFLKHMKRCSNKDEAQNPVFKCCSEQTTEFDHYYSHIIKNHCGHLCSFLKKLKHEDKMDDEKNNKKTTGVVVMEEGCDIGGLLMNLEALTADVQNLVQTPFPIFEFFEKLKQSMPYVSNHSCEHEQEFHFPKDHPFESFEELCCFMLINHFGISKQAYNFMIQMLKSTFKDRPELMKLFVSYDTLKARGNNLNPQKPMQFNDNFILYSVQDTIRNMLMDPYLVNQLCLNREKHQQQFATKQPFQSKIFNKILEKCQSDIFPLVMLIYVDDFVKFRTKSTSTCGVYSSLLNFNSDFMRKLESISLLGFSKTHCDFWTMTSHLMKEINHLDGEIIEIEDPSTGESRKFQIVVAGFLWDTVEKMYSLQLMKEECSRCEGIYDNQHKTPDCLFGASTIEDPKYVTHFEKRNIFEANTVINSIDLRSNDRTKDKGFKPLIWEEMQFKDLKLSKAKITQKLRELPVLHIIDNPFLKYPNTVDAFHKALIDFFHLEIQGTFRTQFKRTMKAIHYSTIMDDFLDVCERERLPNGKRITMYSDIDKLSGTEMLEFIAISAPIWYKFLFLNTKYSDNTLEKRQKLYECWILHLQYFVRLLRFDHTDHDLKEAEKLYVAWRVAYRNCFGSEKCKFPNFHAGCHIFEDVDDIGHVTWFWTLLYELKHSTYKQFNDKSNKKQLEKRASEREMVMKALFTKYPQCRKLIPRAKEPEFKLEKDIFVLFETDQGEMNIAFVKQVTDKVVLSSLIFEVKHMDNVSYMYHLKCIPQLMLSAIDISKVKSKCSCICYSLPSGLKWQLNQFAFCYNFCK